MRSKKQSCFDVSAPQCFPVHGTEGRVGCRVDVYDKQVSVVIEATFLSGSHAVLHWGVGGANQWQQPDPLPPHTVAVGNGKAAETPFEGNNCELQFANPSSVNKTLPPLPNQINFVLKEINGDRENWWKASDCGDFTYVVLPGNQQISSEELRLKFCTPEASYTNWSQFQRYVLCLDVVKERPVSYEQVAWITTILRLSSLRMLDWFRNYNYQPKDFSHVQECLAVCLTDAYNAHDTDVSSKTLLRLCVGYVPRGATSCGDAIRMTILDIMRKHGIKEGHRPGIDDRFLEQWHQKLHTNSAPDDIAICEAYLRFLNTGNVQDFWGYLEHHAFLTRRKLSNMPHPITADPLHLPMLRDSMQEFLRLLKSVHSGADLDYMANCCKGQTSHAAECMVWEILNNRHAWWIPGKINDCRRLISGDIWKRDVLMLDWALENWQLTQLGIVDFTSISEEAALDIISVLLESMMLSIKSPAVAAATNFFHKIRSLQSPHAWSEDWSKMMLAAVERISIICTESVDTIAHDLQIRATALATDITNGNQALERFSVESVSSFGEETVRGLCHVYLTRFISRVNSKLRHHAGAPPWEIISKPSPAVAVVGKPVLVESLAMLPDTRGCTHRLVVCCVKMNGWEDIPSNVAALLVPPGQAVDALSHLAIRARTQGVLLACSADDNIWSANVLPHFKVGKNYYLSLRLDPNHQLNIEVTTVSATVSAAAQSLVDSATPSQYENTSEEEQSPHTISPTTTSSSSPEEKLGAKVADDLHLLTTNESIRQHSKIVGKKSSNLVSLDENRMFKVDGKFSKPKSFVIPLTTFQVELNLPSNKKAQCKLETISQKVNSEIGTDLSNILKSLRDVIVNELEVSENLTFQISRAIDDEPDSIVEEVIAAVKRVWASKWNERATYSRMRSGLPHEQLCMGVLIQKLIDAEYAFVIHTKNPVSDDAESDGMIEIVLGLGEAVVGNLPGKPLNVVSKIQDGELVFNVLHYPSKNRMIKGFPGGAFICRSDSNGEDLAEFAGAGLYDSVPTRDNVIVHADYTGEKLLFDKNYREWLFRKLYWVSRNVLEQCGGVHQDIEGCVKDDTVYVVQTRPQM